MRQSPSTRPFQFSLWSLFVGTTALAVMLGVAIALGFEAIIAVMIAILFCSPMIVFVILVVTEFVFDCYWRFKDRHN